MDYLEHLKCVKFTHKFFNYVIIHGKVNNIIAEIIEKKEQYFNYNFLSNT